jgi:hypothetical protein
LLGYPTLVRAGYNAVDKAFGGEIPPRRWRHSGKFRPAPASRTGEKYLISAT